MNDLSNERLAELIDINDDFARTWGGVVDVETVVALRELLAARAELAGVRAKLDVEANAALDKGRAG